MFIESDFIKIDGMIIFLLEHIAVSRIDSITSIKSLLQTYLVMFDELMHVLYVAVYKNKIIKCSSFNSKNIK